MKKRILTALLATLMVGGTLVGCGGNPSGGDKPAGDETPSGKIVVGGWPSGDDAFKAAEAGFKELYPEVEIEYQFTDTGAFQQSLQTALAAGAEAPDVAMVEGASVGQYQNSPALENLLEEPYAAESMKDDFVEMKWNQCYSLDGTRMIGLPWDIGPTSYFYRRDVFKDAGLPSEPDEVFELMSTWDGVLQVAEAIYKPGERWFYPNASYFYTLMFMNRDFFNEKDLSLRMDREGDIAAIEAALEIRKNGWDANTVDMWSTEAYAGYADGSIASVATGAWFGGFLKTDIDPEGTGNWGITALPGGIPATNWGGSILVLPSQSENKTAAWAFIKYMMTDTTAQNKMFEAVDYYPALKPAWEDKAIYEAEDPYFGGQKTKEVWIDIAEKFPTDVFITLMDSTAEGALYTAVNAGLEAQAAPEQIKTDAAAAVETSVTEQKAQQTQNMKDAGLMQ